MKKKLGDKTFKIYANCFFLFEVLLLVFEFGQKKITHTNEFTNAQTEATRCFSMIFVPVEFSFRILSFFDFLSYFRWLFYFFRCPTQFTVSSLNERDEQKQREREKNRYYFLILDSEK